MYQHVCHGVAVLVDAAACVAFVSDRYVAEVVLVGGIVLGNRAFALCGHGAFPLQDYRSDIVVFAAIGLRQRRQQIPVIGIGAVKGDVRAICFLDLVLVGLRLGQRISRLVAFLLDGNRIVAN